MAWTHFNKPPLGWPLDPDEPINNNLVAWWLNQEGASAGGTLVDIVGGNHGALLADTHSVPGRNGPTLKFDGTGDYVDTADIKEINGATEATWSIWIKPSALSDYDGLIQKYNNGADRISLQLAGAAQSGNDDLLLSIDAQGTFTLGNHLAVGVWTHVVIVYNGGQAESRRVLFYINGNHVGVDVDAATFPPTTLPSNGSNVIFGNDQHAAGRFFNGQIDDVKIYNRAISPSEVELLHRYPFYGLLDEERQNLLFELTESGIAVKEHALTVGGNIFYEGI